MKYIVVLISVVFLIANLTACSSTQTAVTEPAATSAVVQESTEAPKEILYYDSYYSGFYHFPVPESFVDVSIGGEGYADVEQGFEYFPVEESAIVEDVIKDYGLSLMEYGFNPLQGEDNFIYIYSGDLIVGLIEPQDSSFFVYCVVFGEQEEEYDVKAIALNETATASFAEITPVAVAAGTQVKASDELFETTITSRDDNSCLIWLSADLHNKMDTRVEFQYNYYVRFLIDGYEPQEAKLVASPGLPSGSEKTLVWYAEIPRANLENCQSLTVRIGFADQFQNITQKQLADESALLCDVVITGDQLTALKGMIVE